MTIITYEIVPVWPDPTDISQKKRTITEKPAMSTHLMALNLQHYIIAIFQLEIIEPSVFIKVLFLELLAGPPGLFPGIKTAGDMAHATQPHLLSDVCGQR